MTERKLGYEIISLGHLLKREQERTNEEVKQRLLGEDKLAKSVDLNLLHFLAVNKDKEIYQKDIEKYLSLTPPSVSNKLKAFEKLDLVERKYSKKDTRLKQVLLTKKALEINEKLQKEMVSIETKIENILSPKQMKKLSSIIDDLKKVFEEDNNKKDK